MGSIHILPADDDRRHAKHAAELVAAALRSVDQISNASVKRNLEMLLLTASQMLLRLKHGVEPGHDYPSSPRP